MYYKLSNYFYFFIKTYPANATIKRGSSVCTVPPYIITHAS